VLIKIDISVVTYIKSNIQTLSESSNEIMALNNLAISSRNGTHIIFAPLPVLEFLMKLELLDLSSRKTFNSIYSKFAILGSYQTLLNTYVVVKDNTASFIRNKSNIYDVPINYFSHISSIESTNLLCEDISDYYFYTKLAKKFMKEHKLTFNIALSFNFINGGGDRCALNYELILAEKNKLSLAIADSDRKIPNGEIGNTLKGLQRVFSRYKDIKVTDLLSLSVREKENLIPPSIYDLCSNSSLDDLIKNLKMVENSEIHFEKLFYLDIKDGIKAKKLRNGSSELNYYKDMFIEFPELISCTLEEINTLKDDDLVIRGTGPCLMENFIKNVLEDGLNKQLKIKKELGHLDPMIITMLEDKIAIKDQLFDRIPEFIKPHIIDICKTIISWGCSTSQPNSIAG
jgi:hypothetical protein